MRTLGVLAALATCALVVSVARAQPGPDTSSPPSGNFEAPFVDLVTIGPGTKLFETFGHAALCLRHRDPARSVTCFNFGVTDYREGLSMLWRLVRGTQEFWVETETYQQVLAAYRDTEDRDIFIQTLPLTDAQARELATSLDAALHGPGSHYSYDPLFDNCSTRIRDLVDRATGGKLAAGGDAAYPLTFRELARRGYAGSPALLAMSDFLGSRRLDVHPTRWQAMFEPDILRAEVERRLGAAPRQVYERRGEPIPVDGSSGRWPMLAIGLLFALPIAIARSRGRQRLGLVAAYAALLGYVLVVTMPGLWDVFGAVSVACPVLFAGVAAGAAWWRRGKRLALAWAGLELGLMGTIVWGLIVLSPMSGWNDVALVVMPLDLALPVLSLRNRQFYARFRLATVVVVSLLCALGVLVQPLWVPIAIAFPPLALIAFDWPTPPPRHPGKRSSAAAREPGAQHAIGGLERGDAGLAIAAEGGDQLAEGTPGLAVVDDRATERAHEAAGIDAGQ